MILLPVCSGLSGETAMAKLMKASQWGRREFSDGSIPDNRTIKRWVENGLLMGRIVDGSVFVCETENGESTQWLVKLFAS